MSKSQMKGMLKFHRKAEKAYRKAGNLKNAELARSKRLELILILRGSK